MIGFRKIQLVFGVSMISMAAFGNPIGAERIAQELRSIHSVDWPKILQSDNDSTNVRSALEKIIQNPEEFLQKDDSLEAAKNLRHRALADYGHFALDRDGTLASDARRFFENNAPKFKNETDNSVIYFLHGLKNASTPETLEIVTDFISSEDPNVGFFALSMVEEIANSPNRIKRAEALAKEFEARGLHLDGKIYHPNLKVPIKDRPYQSAWREALLATQKRVGDHLSQRTTPEFIRKKGDKVQRILQNLQVQLGHSGGNPGTFNVAAASQQSQRILANVQGSKNSENEFGEKTKDRLTNREPSGSGSGTPIFWLILGSLAVSFIVRRSRRR